MAKNYIEPGDQIDAVAPVGGVTSGEFVVYNGLCGVALSTAEAGQPYALKIRGCFKLPLPGGLAASFGARVYYDSAALTLTPGGLEVGFVVKPILAPGEIGTNEAVVCLGVQTIPVASGGD